MADLSTGNTALIERFYACFGRRDSAGMAACYSVDIDYADPVFVLKGNQVGSMWKMLCDAGHDLKITASHIQADDLNGSAHWEARYTWGGRKVHNRIDAAFRFDQGKIVWHRDRFSLWRWTRMALGPAGLFFGWAPLLHNRVRKMAHGKLERFITTQIKS